MIVFAIQTYNFFSIPFLLLFVFGYYWAGFGTLYQEHQGRMQWLKAQRSWLRSGRKAGQGFYECVSPLSTMRPSRIRTVR